MTVRSTVSIAAQFSCGDDPCFQRIDAFLRCAKPMRCRFSTLRQSRHQLTVFDYDSHHWGLGGASDGFVVAGSVGVPHGGDSSSRSINSLVLGADAISAVIDEGSIGEQRLLRGSSNLHLLGQSAAETVKVYYIMQN